MEMWRRWNSSCPRGRAKPNRLAFACASPLTNDELRDGPVFEELASRSNRSDMQQTVGTSGSATAPESTMFGGDALQVVARPLRLMAEHTRPRSVIRAPSFSPLAL